MKLPILRNLKKVREIFLDEKNHTISMSTGTTQGYHDPKNDINMSPCAFRGDTDDKAIFPTEGMPVLIKIMEGVTGRKFLYTKADGSSIRRYYGI
jgi:hypothetical protein